jgi:nucleoside-diphosphate-sugar epimerase
MTCVLVTGANGFLGQAVVRQFQAQNIRLRTTDRTVTPQPMLPDYRPLDLVEASSFTDLLHGVNCIIHIAGWAHRFHRERVERETFYRINVGVTEKLLGDAIAAGVRHFVFVSSAAVYGPSAGANRRETDLCRPDGPYALSKFEAECRVRELAEQTGIHATILRPVTLFGEGDPGNVVRLINVVDRGRFVWIGSGMNSKSLIHRDDAARGVVQVSQRATGNPVEVYNLAALTPTMREIVEEIAINLGKKPPSLRVPAGFALRLSALLSWFMRGSGRLGTLKNTIEKWLANDVYDGTKLRDAVGFEPQITLSDGLRREVAWYRTAKSVLVPDSLPSEEKLPV